MRKHNYDNMDNKILKFETMYSTTIKMNDATRILKKIIVIINNENRFKHLIENSQFFVSLFINKIDIFTFSIIKIIFKIKNVN